MIDRRRLWLGWLICAMVAAAVALPAAAEGLRKLSEKDIRARIIGQVITDGAHWWDHYRPDGTIESSDMGKRKTGRWQIKASRLCIWRGDLDGDCYEVWVAGDEVELRTDGIEPLPAYLRKPDRR